MPELPEVEAVARMFAPLVAGRKIRACRVLHPIVVSRAAPGGGSGARALSRVRGRRVLGIERRGKYLLLRLDRGWLMIHFRLDGHLVWYARGRRPRHIDVEWEFARGTLGFVDRRHLGRVRWLNRPEDHPGIARLGIDPLSSAFGARRLQGVLEGSRRGIKLLLMDQTRIAGMGNIWTCESLWRAGIDPRRPASRIGPGETRRLAKAIVAVVRRALESCIASAPDVGNPEWWFADADRMARVYGREGRPCRRCGGPIRRIKQGGRSSFYCPGCQR
ncbi:MAG TPA: DNA-formamidopyrimidine glycosylase [Candidatus Acidoferrales bacterium]|nr:DNA-formamidopyrimidine glycosylase [Candidatus Acidoferrales bacterium]